MHGDLKFPAVASHILAEKGLLALLYSKKCNLRRVRPMLDPPLVLGTWELILNVGASRT